LTKIKHLGGRAEWPDRYVGSEESWSNRTALAVAVWRGGKYAQLQFGPGVGTARRPQLDVCRGL